VREPLFQQPVRMQAPCRSAQLVRHVRAEMASSFVHAVVQAFCSMLHRMASADAA
jgi:hypothetical protein